MAVAAHQWDGDAATAVWIAAWLRSAFRGLADDPALSVLADGNPPRLAGMLARPVAHLPNALSVVAGLWRDAGPVRIRARFLDLRNGNDDAQTCRAVVRIGQSVLAWSVRVPGSDPVGVAHLIADAVDEVRYCHPDTGLDRSDALAGALTAAMAAACILDPASLQWLCRRFDGDDGSLAAMAANALANGIAVSEVRAALSTIGEDAAALVARWNGWNGLQTSDSRGELTPMAKLLARLHDANT